jgi:hypothetical protein
MEIKELFKDSLIYPTKEWKKFLMLGTIFLIISIFSILQTFDTVVHKYIAFYILNIALPLLAFVLLLIIMGYTISITRKTIANVDESMPKIKWGDNFGDGIKLLILTIIYYIIPGIIALIMIYVTNTFNQFYLFITYYALGSISSMPESIASIIDTNFLIVLIVLTVVYIIFSLLFLIAKAIFAETESLGAAINITNVFNKIKEITLKNYIIWVVIFTIISCILLGLTELVSIIPYIGIIIVALIINPFVEMFSARSLGLIYNESKK